MINVRNKNVLITGACGSIGTALVNYLLELGTDGPSAIYCFDNNESAVFSLGNFIGESSKVRVFVGDICDRSEVDRRMVGVDFVFHLAALKHVVLSELSPNQVVRTNILGLQNIIASAVKFQVGAVVFSSSDKAVNPTNIMGTSKLMGERLITAANAQSNKSNTRFFSVRFGNVLGSSGSVTTIFQDQIAQGKNLTLTDRRMTRFVMSKTEAVRLILESCEIAKGGEVFVTKMPVIRIKDLAELFIEQLVEQSGYKKNTIQIDQIGSKPGEKLYEELLSLDEARRTLELTDYFVILPAFRDVYKEITYEFSSVINEKIEDGYVSSAYPYMEKSKLLALLRLNGLLN